MQEKSSHISTHPQCLNTVKLKISRM